VLSLAGGVAARLLAPDDFHSFGNAVWWSIVTLLTIGYGDIVPTTPEGRFIGSVIMVVGVTSISAFTAIVTASFVGAHEGELEVERRASATAHEDAVLSSLAAMERRLAEMDAKLDAR